MINSPEKATEDFNYNVFETVIKSFKQLTCFPKFNSKKEVHMKTKSLLLLLAIFYASSTFAQTEDQNQQMKTWMEYMTPGQVHQSMASYAGDWKTENKMWSAPGTEPMVADGFCKIEMFLGGRYLKINYTGNYMGMPFEGLSIEGFDNATEEFNYVWLDNFGTGMVFMKGKYDSKEKTINYKGTMVDPMQKKEVPIRKVVKLLENGNLSRETYSISNGQEFKSMEILYTRK